MNFKKFVQQEELVAEEMGFDQNEPSTFLHYLLLRVLYRETASEELLSLVKANLDVLVDKALGTDIQIFEGDADV